MTHKSKSKSKGKAKPKDLDLNDEFKEKYPEFNRICTIGKNLILEHFQAGPIFSKYYDDDIVRTIDALDETLKTYQHIAVEFYHDRGEDFLRDVGRILAELYSKTHNNHKTMNNDKKEKTSSTN